MFNWTITITDENGNKINKKVPVQLLPPEDLGEGAIETYKYIVYELIKADSIEPKEYKSLLMLADAYDDYFQATDYLIQKGGTTYETCNSRGGVEYKEYPQVKQREAAEKKITKWLDHFGLNPKSSGKFKKGSKAVDVPDIPLDNY